MLISYAYFAVFCVYLIATLCYLLRLVFQKPVYSGLGLRVLMLGAFLQIVTLIGDFTMRVSPKIITYHDYFQFTALFVAVVFVLLSFTKRFYAAGPFVILMIDLFTIFSFQNQSPLVVVQGQKGLGYLLLHFSAIFLSLAVFSIALVTAIMFFLTLSQLRQKTSNSLIRKFPALNVLESVHFNAIKWGFVLLTTVIVTGAGYSKLKAGVYFQSDLKLWLSLLSWGVFALLLNFRFMWGLQGKKGVLMSSFGLAAVMALYIIGI